MIDIRCTGRLPFLPLEGELGRCQLTAGHEGAHALMFSRDGKRVVRTWSRSGGAHVHEHLARQEMSPWARGKPAPAWSEIRRHRRAG